MKHITAITTTLFFLLIITLFLPYVEILSESYSQNGNLINSKLKSGIELEETYPMIIGFLIMLVIVNISKNYATAITGFIINTLILLSMPVLAFFLIFTIFGPEKILKLGFSIASLIIITNFIILIIHMVQMRRKNRLKTSRSSDILDDF